MGSFDVNVHMYLIKVASEAYFAVSILPKAQFTYKYYREYVPS